MVSTIRFQGMWEQGFPGKLVVCSGNDPSPCCWMVAASQHMWTRHRKGGRQDYGIEFSFQLKMNWFTFTHPCITIGCTLDWTGHLGTVAGKIHVATSPTWLWAGRGIHNVKRKRRTREIPQWERVLVTCPENISLVPSPYVRWLTIVCDSSSRI